MLRAIEAWSARRFADVALEAGVALSLALLAAQTVRCVIDAL